MFRSFSGQSVGQPSPAARRHTTGSRPSNLPLATGAHQIEPVPVPTQKAAYLQIQQSLIQMRSRTDSVSAMSGISTASKSSTLGPLPEERAATSKQARSGSPGSGPGCAVKPGDNSGSAKMRRYSAPPVPDIFQVVSGFSFVRRPRPQGGLCHFFFF
jgi:hypothetical protein